jgi:thiol-disulfide isomerase/thioredoxin
MHYSTGNPARRRRLIPCLLLAGALFGTQAPASHEASEPSDGTVNSFRWLKTPAALPEISVEHWPGKRVSLSSFRGKIVLLNLWASWCPPCIRELPALDRLQQRLGGEDFAVVAISLDRSPEPARAMFIDRLGLEHLDFFIEPAESLGKFFPVDVLPSNFIIDREGRAIGMLRSYVDWESRAADEFIERLIDGSLPPGEN